MQHRLAYSSERIKGVRTLLSHEKQFAGRGLRRWCGVLVFLADLGNRPLGVVISPSGRLRLIQINFMLHPGIDFEFMGLQ